MAKLQQKSKPAQNTTKKTCFRNIFSDTITLLSDVITKFPTIKNASNN